MEKIKVLLFAANPRGSAPLDLSREFREIDEEVGRSKHRDAVELIFVPGTRPVDLLRKLNENQPQVVHFSSHGNPDEIILESGDHGAEDSASEIPSTRSADERDMEKGRPQDVEVLGIGQGEPQVVSKSALVNVLRSCDEGNLRLVFLNACSTQTQAEALTEIVDCVVSMNRTITDRAAIMFAASFYGALGFGKSVQKAFEQGLARLSAEGIAEVDTPELLMRAGIDASHAVLLGSAPRIAATPTSEAPFVVPFPRNVEFVGRESDLVRLHAHLSGPGSGPVGIRPAGLTGMGGIGKTQLVVEYVYRHRYDYPDGIFWIDAAGPLDEGFARLATDHRLKWAEIEQPRDEQMRAAFTTLNARPNAVLVLDNLPDPAALAASLSPGCTPEDLRCRLLFTTRRHDLGRFAGIEVTILLEEPALQLLLRHPSRRAALGAAHSDHDHARAIARMLGRLPLALELAGAYLGKYSRDVSLAGYREALRSDGVLATLDADAAELSEADLRRMHDPAVAATIGEQWASMRDESARLLLRVASLFSESTAVPLVRLGLLAGLGDEARPGRRSPLRRAAQLLEDACLVERLEGDQVRLHPLIREFAAGQTPPAYAEDFRRECSTKAAIALERFQTLEAIDALRGVDSLQEDLIAFLDLCPKSDPDLAARLQRVLRLMQREAHNLRVREARTASAFFAQQVRNRAVLFNITPIRSSADERLAALCEPHFALRWTASRESPDLVRTLAGHADWVSAVAVTLSGRHAISGSGDRTLKFWDLQTGQLLRTIAGHEAGVKAVSISPDGGRALSAAGDRTLKLWDLGSGQLLRTFVGHEDVVTTIALSAEWRRALSGSLDRTLRLWDLLTGETLRVFDDHTDGVTALSMTRDGFQALSGSRDHTLRLWDLKTGQVLRTLTDHGAMVCTVAVSPDGRRALSGSEDHNVKFWDLQTGQLLRKFAGHEDGVSALSVTPDWRQALSGSHDRTLRLWDLQSGQLLRTFAGHDFGVSAVVITADGRHALSGGDDRTVKFWDLGTGQSSTMSIGHEGPVNAVTLRFDAGLALSGSRDRTLKLWDLPTGQLLCTLGGHEQGVSSVAMSFDGRFAISGSYDHTVKLWNLRTGQLLRSFEGHEDSVSSVALSPDGLSALSGSSDRTLRLWDLARGEEVQSFYRTLTRAELRGVQETLILQSHSHWINAVAITSNGRCAVSGSHDRTLKIWDLRTGDLIRSLVGHTDTIHTLAVSPNDRYALSGSADRTFRLWDLSTGELLHCFTGHSGIVSAVAIFPDGLHALSGSYDRTLKLWDLNDHTCLATLPLESSPLSIAVGSDGRSIVLGDRVGNVHHFQIHLGED